MIATCKIKRELLNRVKALRETNSSLSITPHLPDLNSFVMVWLRLLNSLLSKTPQNNHLRKNRKPISKKVWLTRKKYIGTLNRTITISIAKNRTEWIYTSHSLKHKLWRTTAIWIKRIEISSKPFSVFRSQPELKVLYSMRFRQRIVIEECQTKEGSFLKRSSWLLITSTLRIRSIPKMIKMSMICSNK